MLIRNTSIVGKAEACCQHRMARCISSGEGEVACFRFPPSVRYQADWNDAHSGFSLLATIADLSLNSSIAVQKKIQPSQVGQHNLALISLKKAVKVPRRGGSVQRLRAMFDQSRVWVASHSLAAPPPPPPPVSLHRRRRRECKRLPGANTINICA